MAATSNTFEGLSNGTGITSGNSGGASGDAFDLMTLGSGATATADTSKSAHGSVSMKLATGVSAADCVAEWTSKIGTQTTLFVRMYLWIPSNPGTNHRLFDLVASPNLCGALYLTTTGKVEAVDTGGGQMTITTNSVALSQWIRVEAKYTASATVGQAEVRLYNSADSTTADEIKISAASFNTQASFNEYRFGAAGDPMPANRTIWYDDIGLSTVAFLGPAGAALVPQIKPGRTWRRRFKHWQTLPLPPVAAAGASIDADAALTVTAATTAAADRIANVDAALIVTASRTATATADFVATASRTTTATITATASRAQPIDASLTATATITATATVTRAATASLTTTATITPTATLTAVVTATRTTTATITADAAVGVVAQLTTTATITATAVRLADASASLTGTASRTAAATVTAAATASLSTTAAITAGAMVVKSASASLTVTATIVAESLGSITFRPNDGITARPSSGTTARPTSGITIRVASGITVRPFTGITTSP